MILRVLTTSLLFIVVDKDFNLCNPLATSFFFYSVAYIRKMMRKNVAMAEFIGPKMT